MAVIVATMTSCFEKHLLVEIGVTCLICAVDVTLPLNVPHKSKHTDAGKCNDLMEVVSHATTTVMCKSA